MAQLIEIHKPGEIIFTMGRTGGVQAWMVMDDGQLRPMDLEAALEQEEHR
jgi:hypothetical protein